MEIMIISLYFNGSRWERQQRNSMESVHVEVLNTQVIKMTWQHRVNEIDVGRAFDKINQLLNENDGPRFVLVDISAKPQFPLMTTVHSAVAGPYRNPRLREWLIVGSNRLAHMVEKTLASVTNRRNVVWFNTEADALAYAAGSTLENVK